MGKLETDERVIQERVEAVRRAASKSVSALLSDVRQGGLTVAKAVIVGGSVVDPLRIANPHIRAHALEGQLFVKVLRDALTAEEVDAEVVTERNLLERTANQDIRQALVRLGGALRPWRSDQKLSALAAWLALGR